MPTKVLGQSGERTQWRLLPLLVGLMCLLLPTGVALALHQHPGSGTPVHVPLVNAYNTCPAAGVNSTHGPEGLPSCSPPAATSPFLRTSTGGGAAGSVDLKVFCTNAQAPPCPAAGDQEDVQVTVLQNDVRCNVAGYFCAAANDDYAGPVLLRLPIRITDHYNGPAGPIPPACANGAGMPPCVTATVADQVTFGFPIGCAPVGPPTPPGSNCAVATTIDAVVPPTLVTEFQRASFQVGQISLQDPGADMSPGGAGCPYACGTGDENQFLVQGWFAP